MAIDGHQHHAPARGWLGKGEQHTMSEQKNGGTAGSAVPYRGPWADSTPGDAFGLPRYDPAPDSDGVIVCKGCGEGWSNHTMDGHCLTD